MTVVERPISVANKHRTLDQSRVCAIITTFEPADNLAHLISAAITQVGRVFLIDDSGSSQTRDRLDLELSTTPKLSVYHMVSNSGIASALNHGLNAASCMGFRRAVLLDDDTRISPDLVTSLCQAWLQLERVGQEPGVIGVSRSEIPLDLDGYRADLDGHGENPEEFQWDSVRGVITAGSMVDIRLALDLGGFREEFVIDAVDYEFCARVRQRGLLVAKISKCLMVQPVGSVSTVRIAGIKFSTTNHSPIRRYYMFRNNLVFAREQLFKDPLLSIAILWFLIKTCFLIVCVEQQRRPKLAAIIRGIQDGVRRRGGLIGSKDGLV